MPAIATSDAFLALIRKSRLIDRDHLDSYIAERKARDSLPENPRKLASKMMRDGLLTRFQAEQLLSGRWRRFDVCAKYRLLERLGSGGMGSVFLCAHLHLRRRVAIKMLPLARAQDVASRERFFREARAFARMKHPNIVRAFDVDEDNGIYCLVMEYVDGASLHDIVARSGPLEFHRAAHCVAQAASGLEHAHQVGMVHRNIKPGNLLVDRQGIVKILDLGLVRLFNDASENLTRQHDPMAILGTAEYLAPEQAVDSHEVDIRADVYSLGVTFYYLLTGKAPFTGGSLSHRILMHQIQRPKPIRHFRPDVPANLEAVVERMMAKNPADRYQAPGEVVVALADWTKSPIPPPSEKEMPRLSRAARDPGSVLWKRRRKSATSGDPNQEEEVKTRSGKDTEHALSLADTDPRTAQQILKSEEPSAAISATQTPAVLTGRLLLLGLVCAVLTAFAVFMLGTWVLR